MAGGPGDHPGLCDALPLLRSCEHRPLSDGAGPVRSGHPIPHVAQLVASNDPSIRECTSSRFSAPASSPLVTTAYIRPFASR